MGREGFKLNNLTTEDDVHEISTVDEASTMKNFVILRCLFLGTQSGRVFEVLILVNVENALSDKL
jgi:hypothetical protein